MGDPRSRRAGLFSLHRAEIGGRHADFGQFVDPYVCGWPQNYTTSQLKLVIVWEDNEGRKHASVSPGILQLVGYCSGAKSAVPPSFAASANYLAINDASGFTAA